MAEIMYISCLCATLEGSTPPGILANDYLMLPTLLFFVRQMGLYKILGSWMKAALPSICGAVTWNVHYFGHVRSTIPRLVLRFNLKGRIWFDGSPTRHCILSDTVCVWTMISLMPEATTSSAHNDICKIKIVEP
jgi:hypothetical protein